MNRSERGLRGLEPNQRVLNKKGRQGDFEAVGEKSRIKLTECVKSYILSIYDLSPRSTGGCHKSQDASHQVSLGENFPILPAGAIRYTDSPG